MKCTKRWTAFFLLLLLMNLTGCGLVRKLGLLSDHTDDVGGANQDLFEENEQALFDQRLADLEQEEMEQQEGQETDVDLSAYDDHGTWQCGRMWVHKSEGGYDHLNGYYAYINERGEVITDWHLDDEWVEPQDFKNDRALVYTGEERAERMGVERGQNLIPTSYDVVDLEGRTIAVFAGTLCGNPDKQLPHYEANSYGLVFYQKLCSYKNGWVDQMEHHVILEDGRDITCSYASESYDLNKQIIQTDTEGFRDHFANGYLYFQDTVKDSGGSGNVCLFFDRNGDVAVNLSGFPYPVKTASDVSGEDTIVVTFYGVDGNYYDVTVDLEGNWLDEPKLTEA